MADTIKKPKQIPQLTTFDGFMNEVNPLAVQQEDKREQFFKTVMEENFSIKNPEVRSDLNMEQIHAYSIGFVISDFLDPVNGDEIITGLIKHRLLMAYSKGRGSRHEMAEMAKGMAPLEDPDMLQRKSVSDTLFGHSRR